MKQYYRTLIRKITKISKTKYAFGIAALLWASFPFEANSQCSVPQPSVSGDARCGAGNVNLSASGTGTLLWYDSPTGGALVNSGSSYSPNLSSTATYYVEDIVDGPSYTHTTTLIGGSSSNGNMFAITALNTITITGFDGHTSGGTSTWEIYYRPDDYTTVPNANASSNGWISLGTASNVPSSGSGLPTPIPITFSVTIPAGSTYSFHVVTTAGTIVQYTYGTSVGAVYNSNSDFQFREGHGGGLFSCFNVPRVFNGNIHYNTTCTSPRVPVTAIINPVPAVTASASNTSICSGSSIDLASSIAPIATVFAEPFENFPLTQMATGGNGITASKDTTYFSQGSSAMLVTYVNSAGGYVEMTSDIDLSSYPMPQFQFSHICAAEANYDYGYIQYSTDGGINWTSFPPSSYTGTGILKNGVVSFDKSSYPDWNIQFSGSTTNPGAGPATSLWKVETIDLSAYQASTQFRVRFRLTSDGSIVYFGWLIDDVKIYSTSSYSYSWTSSPSGFTSSVQDPAGVVPTASTTYNVTVTDLATSCFSSASVPVTVNPLPAISVLATANSICEGDSTFLTASGAQSYTWTPATGLSAFTGTTVTANPGVTTTYSVTGTDINGCVNSAPFTVTVNPLPMVSLTHFNPVCVNDPTFVITGESPVGGSYSGTGVNAGMFDPMMAGPGAHIITYTFVDAATGCVNSASDNITVNALPAITLSSYTPVCAGSAAVGLSGASPAGGVYSGTGVNNNMFDPVVAGPGIHYVVYSYTDGNGCSNSDSVAIVVSEANVNLGADTTICNSNTITLDAGNGFSSYLWSTGATTQTITVSASGTYVVTVANSDNCQDSDTLIVTVDPCTGINENGSSYVISVRPNPSEGIFNLVIGGAEIAKLDVEILDIQGKLVYGFVEKNISGDFIKEINLEGFAKGVYYLRMNTGTTIVTEKLVIQ